MDWWDFDIEKLVGLGDSGIISISSCWGRKIMFGCGQSFIYCFIFLLSQERYNKISREVRKKNALLCRINILLRATPWTNTKSSQLLKSSQMPKVLQKEGGNIGLAKL